MSVGGGNFVVGPNGAITAKSADFGTGALSAGSGTFSGDVSGVKGSFSGAVSGTTGTFSAGVSGTTGSFSGNVTSSGTMRAAKTSSVGAACVAGEIASDGDGTTLACVKKKWSVWNKVPPPPPCTFTSKLFTSNGTFTAPAGCNGKYEITVIGAGGGGGYESISSGGGGGGSSAFYGGAVSAIIAAGGGGGSVLTGGASGAVVISTVSLVKGTAYTVRLGQGGRSGHNANVTAAGGAGYSAGKSPSNTVANARGCLVNACFCGGDGGDYGSTYIHGGDYYTAFLGGAGGRLPGRNYASDDADATGGAGYTISGVGTFGAGGHGYYFPAGSQTDGSAGAVYVKLVK